MRAFDSHGKIYQFHFDRATIFDLENVFGLPDSFKEKINHYSVYDWYDVLGGAVHEHKTIECESDFVKRITFFLSSRIDGNKNKKDLVVYSKMSKANVESPNYSDTYVKFKTTDIMKENGIKNPNLRFWKRQIIPVKAPAIFSHENIAYINMETK